MNVQANVMGFLQVSASDPVGSNAPLVVPQRVRVNNEYANASRLLAFQVPAELHPLFPAGTVEVELTQYPDEDSAADAAAQAHLDQVFNSDPAQWRPSRVSSDHYGTPTGWTPVGTGGHGYLFEIEKSNDGGVTWTAVYDNPRTYDSEFGGHSLVQPVLSLWW